MRTTITIDNDLLERARAISAKLRTPFKVANLAADGHLAALAIEHGCDFASTDYDFSRFPKLKCINPLLP